MRLWDYPGDITQRMNKYQLRLLWTDINITPPVKVLASDLEAAINSQPMGYNISIEELNIEKKGRRQGQKITTPYPSYEGTLG